MFTIKQPSTIVFGNKSAQNFPLPENSLVITSNGAKSRGWFDYIGLKNASIFDNVESNPSFTTVEKILNEFKTSEFSSIIGIGGGSSLDVAKFVAFKMKKRKFLIPTTFGSGSEVTRISVLKINGKKQSFHDDALFADVAIIDSHFIQNSSDKVIKNSVIDACAQSTEGYDSKLGNIYTKFMCEKAFDLLENGIIHKNYENIVLGSLYAGLGFGNCSTTLGHALSYVFSNEGIPHGHALAFTTTVAHKFNNSKFYTRFKHLVEILNFDPIHLNQHMKDAVKLIQKDRKHLDNNPKVVSDADIVNLLTLINNQQVF
ncbi:iron-containing alcohol dehydrogenase [Nitrosopumilus sp.]|uniref:iron-containing alcohol dehydrogenase n=1 Tax=Nitrosopumilus sp. TaxID=2024843 RepID=UPI0034A08F46